MSLQGDKYIRQGLEDGSLMIVDGDIVGCNTQKKNDTMDDDPQIKKHGLKFTPKPHQVVAIEHGIKHPLSAWFIEMGLGKTAARLAVWDFLFCDGALKGVLVVAPLRVAVLTWPDEVDKWDNFRWMRVADLRTKEGKQAWIDQTADIYTINYEALPRFTNEFIKGKRASELPVNEVFFDESDNAKNPGSKRINQFRKFGRPKFGRCGIQTGTPISNNRLDLFAQIRLLDQGETWKCPTNPKGTAFTRWKNQYFQADNPHAEWPKFVPREGSVELLETKIAPLTLVQFSKDHGNWTSPVVHDIPVSLPVAAKKTYKKVEKELLETLSDGFEIIAPNAAALVTKLLQITSGAVYVQQEEDVSTRKPETLHTAKLEALKKLHKSHGNRPMLVACQYIHEVDRILVSVPGAEKFTNERLAVWNRGEIPMIVAHPKSIGHGLNLQAGGNLICWFTLGYSRGLYDQFNARLARQGQELETQIFRLICGGTIDDAVANALESKDKDQQAFLQTLKNIKRLAAV